MDPPRKQGRPPGGGAGQAAADGFGKDLAPTSSPDRTARQHRAAELRLDPRFRLLTKRLHRLGPRPTGELLLELIEVHSIEADVLARLEEYAQLDPIAVARLEARDWPPLPIRRAA